MNCSRSAHIIAMRHPLEPLIELLALADQRIGGITTQRARVHQQEEKISAAGLTLLPRNKIAYVVGGYSDAPILVPVGIIIIELTFFADFENPDRQFLLQVIDSSLFQLLDLFQEFLFSLV